MIRAASPRRTGLEIFFNVARGTMVETATSVGIEELHTYWARHCAPGSVAPLPQDVEKTLLAGLRLNILESLRYLHHQKPSYAQFEGWIYERNGGELDG